MSSTKSDINIRLVKAEAEIEKLTTISRCKKIKPEFRNRIKINVSIHYWDFSEMLGEKTWWELHKNTVYYFQHPTK